MSIDPLVYLRSSIAAKLEPKFSVSEDGNEPTDDITQAKGLVFGPIPGLTEAQTTVIPLDTPTRFELPDPAPHRVDLRVVYNCWITRDLSIADYISLSEDRGITNLKFLERTDLITWLEGASLESEYIKEADASADKDTVMDGTEEADADRTTTAATGDAKSSSSGAVGAKAGSSEGLLGLSIAPTKHEIPEQLQEIYLKERSLVDHNKALRGNKVIDFSSVSVECKQKIMNAYKNNLKNKSSGRGVSKDTALSSSGSTPKNGSGKNKEPIIILSPSASSLINMANVKEFLETGVFKPVTMSGGTPDIQRIAHTSAKLGNVRIVVVNSVDKFKPEYWDRVIAVFVTGQAWQFKPYMWSDPNTLFRKVLGFGLTYKGDPVPPTLQQWNVQLETLDRAQRFKDKQVVQNIWESLERAMVAKGFTFRK